MKNQGVYRRLLNVLKITQGRGDVVKVAKKLNIPKTTVYTWRSDDRVNIPMVREKAPYITDGEIEYLREDTVNPTKRTETPLAATPGGQAGETPVPAHDGLKGAGNAPDELKIEREARIRAEAERDLLRGLLREAAECHRKAPEPGPPVKAQNGQHGK